MLLASGSGSDKEPGNGVSVPVESRADPEAVRNVAHRTRVWLKRAREQAQHVIKYQDGRQQEAVAAQTKVQSQTQSPQTTTQQYTGPQTTLQTQTEPPTQTTQSPQPPQTTTQAPQTTTTPTSPDAGFGSN